jgi:hypothetical protein
MAGMACIISSAALSAGFKPGPRRAPLRRYGAALAMVLASALLLPAAGVWAQDAPHKPLQPSPEFAQFPRYVGILGSHKIELLLGPKSDEPSGLHGEYHVLDTGAVVLVAGDRDGDTLALEESDDGTHITGQWVGQFSNNGGLSGDRMNDDETETLPYTLHLEPRAAAQ